MARKSDSISAIESWRKWKLIEFLTRCGVARSWENSRSRDRSGLVRNFAPKWTIFEMKSGKSFEIFEIFDTKSKIFKNVKNAQKWWICSKITFFRRKNEFLQKLKNFKKNWKIQIFREKIEKQIPFGSAPPGSPTTFSGPPGGAPPVPEWDFAVFFAKFLEFITAGRYRFYHENVKSWLRENPIRKVPSKVGANES